MDIQLSYTDLKNIIQSKNLLWQYTEFTEKYLIYSTDGPLVYITGIYKSGYEPIGTSDSTNRSDFEGNYKSTGNSSILATQFRNAAVKGYVSLTNTTETTLIAAQGSGIFTDLTLLIFASTATSSQTTITVRDVTSGNIVMSIIVPGNTVGVIVPFDPPFPQTTANNNWTVQSSVAISNGVKITVLGLKHT
jgi:hypothetical protein